MLTHWLKGSVKCSSHPEQFKGDVDAVIDTYSPQHTAQAYEVVFKEVLGGR